MADISAHDWFKPRLTRLVAKAAEAGLSRDVAVAVITDLINGPMFAPDTPAPIDEKWAQDIGEPVSASQEMPGANSTPDSFNEIGVPEAIPRVRYNGPI